MEHKIIQITAGRGPSECCKVVANVLKQMFRQAENLAFQLTILDEKEGEEKNTLLSVVLDIKGENLAAFITEWEGTIQWIAQSPYRKQHKRKNWFVGVRFFEAKSFSAWNEKEVIFETFRSSGAGGQNVNKVETAVRATHLPSLIQVVSMDSRSQIQNKKLCLERLQNKVLAWKMEQLIAQQQSQWEEHSALERGNAVKVIREKL